MLKKLKYLCYFFLASCFLIALLVLLCNAVVKRSTSSLLYSNVENIPTHHVGLLLGTSKYLSNGQINLYYQYRINAAVQLMEAKKINRILVSGDNSRKNYDEPSEFKADLIARGIAEEKIYLDYAGFRTLDSVVRCKEIFGQDSITIISQAFHNERAIFIANQNQIYAVGFNAQDVQKRYGLKTKARELLARVKLMLDTLFGTSPKFLGEKIIIE